MVASFDSAARTVGEVAAEAAKRVMMSPVLGDFIEFGFAALGPQPGEGGDPSAALRAITDALLGPQAIAGLNYFAVVVVDRSAVVAEQLITQCAGSPFISDLRPRFLGISNSDNRPARDRPGAGARIVTSPTGIWSAKDDMVAVLYRFADTLQRSLAVTHEAGLPASELAGLRARYHQHATLAIGPGPASGHAPDMLASDPLAPVTAAAPEPERQPAPGPAQADTVGQPPSAQLQPVHRDAEPALASPELDELPRPASQARRWLPELRRERRKQTETGTEDAGARTSTERLIYLLIVGDASFHDEVALNRNRSALLEVDKKLAELPGFSYRVRMLYGDEDSLRGELREAGQLGRRDVKRTVASGDFAAVLDHIERSLRRDRAVSKAASGDEFPMVLLLTPEPPSPRRSGRAFRDLAREAMVVLGAAEKCEGAALRGFRRCPRCPGDRRRSGNRRRGRRTARRRR